MTNATLEKKEFTFDPLEHVYTLGGKPMHGVTTVLKVINKPALVPWSAKCVVEYIKEHAMKSEEAFGWFVDEKMLNEAKMSHQKKKEDAGTAGTDVHAQIETAINEAISVYGGYADKVVYAEHVPQVVKFIQWATENKVKFLASEQRLYSESLWCAGTADFVCEIEGKLYIGDVKTSSAIYPEYFIQTSAYAKFAEEMDMNEGSLEWMFGKKGFDGVIIVNVPKKGGLVVKENYDISGNWECFKACLTIHKQLQAITPKK